MDFLETIFSFVPLLMIILFVARIAKAAGKKNRPKPLNTIPPADAEENRQNEAAGSVTRPLREKNRKGNRKKSPLRETPPVNKKKVFDRSSFAANAGAKPVAEAPPLGKTAAPFEPAQPVSEGSLDEYVEKIKQPQKADSSARSLKRLKSLPELQKAVIWAEILGKPKGFE